MLSKTKNVALAMLFWCGCAQAAQHCASTALYRQLMAAADTNMGSFVLFRGEIMAIQRQQPPPAGCCVGAHCVTVLCSEPKVKVPITPTVLVDYAVDETLWGDIKPVIHKTYQSSWPCAASNPVLHDKIITFCATFAGWPEDGPMYCQRPIADTEDNLRKVRAWVPQAISRHVREKVSEEEARAHLAYTVKPVYPKSDLSSGKSRVKEDVVLRIFISRQGRVQASRALSGSSLLGQSAINAVSLWRYKPFLAGDRPIKVDTTVTVHF